jgi:RimJ/RimL family protein N-acetyltransferase
VAHPYWPLFDLRVRTPRLELRLPDDHDIVRLAAIAADGVHDPEWMPFTIPWTDNPSPQLEQEALKWWWGRRAEWSPAKWTFTAAVVVDGEPVGVQDVNATDFAILKTVATGSWLGRRHQGRGIGKEMRAAILHFAFEGLGAVEAYSGAFADNAASRAVSASLGYDQNGTEIARRRDEAATMVRLRLTREAWERHRRDDIVIEGLDACLAMFGVG